MALVDEIERLGALVERDELSRDDAAQRLLEYSEGGLTTVGALDILRLWRSARRRYHAAFGETEG